MKKETFFVLAAVILIGSLFLDNAHAKQAPAAARTIDAIVSTDWLAANLGLENLAILDVRPPGDYTAGHIPNSINVPFGPPWITERGGLALELPEEAALFKTIGALGVTSESPVVIVTTKVSPPIPPYALAAATRVAETLIYAGIKNVAILDGGYPKWATEGRSKAEGKSPSVNAVTYKGKANKDMCASLEYVQKRSKDAVIIDARDSDVYFGVTIEPFASKAGHIPNAKSLPTPWMWNRDKDGTYNGTYKDADTLRAMASGVIGRDQTKEVIVYCGVGGYASSWWFVLTQVLGYENVKIYDGAAQEWALHYDMVPYQWD